MPITNPYPSSYNTAGQAKAREQKRKEENETEEKNKKIPAFMFQGFGFRPQYRTFRGGMYIEGPLCPRENIKKEPCLSELLGESEKIEVTCDVCGFDGKLPYPFQRFKEIAYKKYRGQLRYLESGGKIETLDVPYEAIRAENEDETRIIKIKWSQKNGRNMAVIYFIKKDQKKGEKCQIMVDFDRQEIRHDASDILPEKVLAMIQAVFPKTKIKIEYSDNK